MKKHGTTTEGTTSNSEAWQEFIQQIPTQAATPREKRVEDTEDTATNRHRAREKTTKNTRRKDEHKKVGSIWDMPENDRKMTFAVRESEQQQDWNPNHDHTLEIRSIYWELGEWCWRSDETELPSGGPCTMVPVADRWELCNGFSDGAPFETETIDQSIIKHRKAPHPSSSGLGFDNWEGMEFFLAACHSGDTLQNRRAGGAVV